MANALAGTSSPYLQQHAENPVDWHPWSAEILERAKSEDKPLLISIGYSACHWCHVMAHESFENAEIAALMNEHFICIKVDREERPDIDAIYMDACQTLTGGGGWPLNAFATPDGRPFFAGTYFPPEPVQGMASWPQVLTTMAQTWAERRDEVEEQGTKLGEALSGGALLDPQTDIPGEDFLEEALAELRKGFDSVHGGFGQAPKFPPSTVLGFLLRLDELPMAEYTLTSMATGGIFDQVGGGFSRYSVDERWSVPHFEKMLYDNALLALRYAEASHATGNDWYGQIAERTLDWVLRDLGDVDGGIASALDADSGGVEGSFYVWTPAQIREVLDPADAEAAIRWFAVTGAGNFEGGTTVLESRGEAPDPEQAGRIVLGLAQARESRTRPSRDGKRIVSWNALAIEALAASGVLLGRKDHLDEARRAAGLILDRALDENARVLRLIPTRPGAAAREGIPAGVLDDHAHLLQALVALYEATFEERWLRAAIGIAGALVRDFADEERGGFFSTASDHEALVTRRKDFDDSPIPSGQSSATLGLLRLHALTGDRAHLEAAEGVLRLGAQIAAQHPIGLGQMLIALDQHAATPREVAIIGDGPGAEALIATAREYAGFTTVVAAGPPAGDDGIVPLLAGRGLVDGKPAAYVCERFACKQPVTTPEALEELLD